MEWKKVVAALFIAVMWFAGCSQYEARLPETGATLEGTVTYGGENVPMALISVLGEKGQGNGQVEEAGQYKVENVPLGAVKIGVNTEAMKSNFMSQQMAQSYKGPNAKGGGKATGLRFVSVPPKYQDPETSGVTTTIKRGKNSLDIVLTAGK